MGTISILYNLQNKLEARELGEFSGDGFLIPSAESGVSLAIAQSEDVRYIFVNERHTDDDGLLVLTPDFGKYVAGDRVTITGRISRDAPLNGWCMQLHRCHPNGDFRVVQQVFPSADRMFSLSHVLSARDEESFIRIGTYTFLRGLAPSDFFVDGILITRAEEGFMRDTRRVVYNMKDDQLLHELNGGGYSEFLFASGDPLYTVNGGKIHVSRRANDWDGIDVRTSLMNLLEGNRYTLRVEGKVDGIAPEGAEIMLQILPGYATKAVKTLSANGKFILSHTFSQEELATLEAVRIATNTAGVKADFHIFGIEIYI